jgi:choline dehydrogenase
VATVNERSLGIPLAAEVLRYLVTGKGILTYSASLAGLGQGARGPPTCSAASSPAASRTARSAELDDFPGITAGTRQMRPLSRGYVEARSPNPAEAPAINLRYLSDPTDRRAMIGGLRFIRRLFAAPAVARYCGAEILPGAAVESDDELLDYARQKSSTVYHATCTCKMGGDRIAVVDDQLGVHGIEGLRVIDASVMPTVTSTNTTATTIIIAELGSVRTLWRRCRFQCTGIQCRRVAASPRLPRSPPFSGTGRPNLFPRASHRVARSS